MTDRELIDLARAYQARAYAPYSNFRVGTALLCEDGTVFGGCNVENAAYGECICAERTALLKAVSEGRRQFRRIAVIGSGGDYCWPCGSCRQVLSEFSPDLTVLAADQSGRFEAVPLRELLPRHFGSSQLDEG